MSKYLRFDFAEKQKPKTSVHNVIGRFSGTHLGQIKWFSRWRQYTFFPLPNTAFNIECMNDISEFIQGLMDQRKKK